MAEEKVKPYLDYLDKEMTIMGILSTFSVAVPALVIERVASATGDSFLHKLWLNSEMYLWISSGLMLVSAAFFYIERASLAWHCGQTLLSIAIPEHHTNTWQQWLKDADSWATWRPYDIAFTAMRSAFYGYSLSIVNVGQTTISCFSVPSLLLIAITIELLFLVVRVIAKTKHRYEDHPLRMLFRR